MARAFLLERGRRAAHSMLGGQLRFGRDIGRGSNLKFG
jgi:hypothetical protein